MQINRKYIQVLFIVLCFFIPSTISAKKQAKLVLETRTVDFGKFDKSEPQSYILKFKNKGNANLVISDIKTDCSCTKVTFPKDFIEKGKSGEIQIRIDMNYLFYHESFAKNITIFCNGKESKINVKIIGSVL